MVSLPNCIRPFRVHYLRNNVPCDIVVLAKSECHAVQVLFRYFELVEECLDSITFDRNFPECYVSDIYHFSDALYKHFKKYGFD